MDKLTATPPMMRRAMNDNPTITIFHREQREQYKYDLYIRCRIQNNILKIALFWTANMHRGSNRPIYEIYFSRADDQFITYDCTSKKWRNAKLDVLEWPEYRYWYGMKIWINKKTRLTIQNYLETDKAIYKALIDFQLQIRDKQLQLRHKKETDKWDNDLAQTPSLPKDWKHWVDKVGIQDNFIFYKYKKGGAKTGYCTYCDKEVPIQHPLHNKIGQCSHCRHRITFKCIGRAGRFSTNTYYFYLFQRCKDGIMLREFEGSRIYLKGMYMTPRLLCFEYRRVICDKSSIPQRTYYWGLYKQINHRWIQGILSRSGWYGDFRGMIYGKTMPNLFKNELKQTGFREYLSKYKMIDPEQFLIAYKNHPFIEKLLKVGLFSLAMEYIENAHYYFNITLSTNKNSLTKLLCIDKQELKRLRHFNGDSKLLNWLQYENKSHKRIPDSVIQWFCHEDISPKDLEFINDKMSIMQIYNYINRQKSELCLSGRAIVTTWADYLSMAKSLDMDTNDEIIYRVRKLKQRHDELVRLCKSKELAIRAAEILKQYPNINIICQSLKDKYEYSNNKYAIIVPNRIEDIILEGRTLHHCISDSDRYWDRIERKETYIVFLRKTTNPSVPYYTLEIEPNGTIRQKRTMFDRQEADIQQAEEFLLQWQKIVAQRITTEDRILAKRSCELREIEFEQLRKNKVTINTGALSGTPLIDILMNDLMENVA